MRNLEFNGLGLQETPLDREERWWGKDPVTDHVTRGHILKFVMADILGFIFLCSLLAEDGRTLHTNTGLPPGGSSLFESQMGKIMAWGHSSDGPSPMLWRAADSWDFYSNRTEKKCKLRLFPNTPVEAPGGGDRKLDTSASAKGFRYYLLTLRLWVGGS